MITISQNFLLTIASWLAVVLVLSLTAPVAEAGAVCDFGRIEVGIPFGSALTERTDICAVASEAGSGNPTGAVGQHLFRPVAILLTVLVIMSGTLAVVWGGYIYMTAAGNASRVGLAKAWVGSGLLGIAIALTAFVVLGSINQSFLGN